MCIAGPTDDQLLNVNRFARHYHRKEMNIDQVEAMYRKLTDKIDARMTPHRFRHTLATDPMKQPERNIHSTKNLLNHSNIATTMNYIEADYDHMRLVLHERGPAQGALQNVRRVDDSGALPQTRNANCTFGATPAAVVSSARAPRSSAAAGAQLAHACQSCGEYGVVCSAACIQPTAFRSARGSIQAHDAVHHDRKPARDAFIRET